MLWRQLIINYPFVKVSYPLKQGLKQFTLRKKENKNES